MNKIVISLLLGALLSACASHTVLPNGPAGHISKESGHADCPACSAIVSYRSDLSFSAEQRSNEAHFKGWLETRASLQASNHSAGEAYGYRVRLDISANGNYLGVLPVVADNLPSDLVQQQDVDQLHAWQLDVTGRRRALPLVAWSRDLPLQNFQCRTAPADGSCSWTQYVELPASAVEESMRLHTPLRLFVGSTYSSTVYGMRSYSKPTASVLTQYKGVIVELPAEHVQAFSQAMKLLDVEIKQ